MSVSQERTGLVSDTETIVPYALPAPTRHSDGVTNTPSMPESAAEVRDSKALDVGMRVGLVAYGAMHLLFAFIALQLSWTDQSTSSSGAISNLAQDTLGQVVLWAAGLGLVLLAVWQGAEAAAGYTYQEGSTRIRKRVQSAGRTVIYLALAWMAISHAAGLSGGGSSEDSLTARLMKAPGGQWLVAAVGLGIIAVAARKVVKGVKKKFTEDLAPEATTGDSGRTLIRLGQVGYIAKGFALAVVGALFVWAAITFDPQKAGGLDAALRTLLDQPYGKYLLTAVGVGLAAFGAYCFGWARHPRT